MVVVSLRIKKPVDETQDSHWSTVKVNRALPITQLPHMFSWCGC